MNSDVMFSLFSMAMFSSYGIAGMYFCGSFLDALGLKKYKYDRLSLTISLILFSASFFVLYKIDYISNSRMDIIYYFIPSAIAGIIWTPLFLMMMKSLDKAIKKPKYFRLIISFTILAWSLFVIWMKTPGYKYLLI